MIIRDLEVWQSLVGKEAISWYTARGRGTTSLIDTSKSEICEFCDRFVSKHYPVYTKYRI